MRSLPAELHVHQCDAGTHQLNLFPDHIGKKFPSMLSFEPIPLLIWLLETIRFPQFFRDVVSIQS